MRRSLLLLTFFFIISNALFAQIFRFGVPNLEAYDMKRFHWGFSLGLDIVDLNLKTKQDFDYTNRLSGSEKKLLQIYSKPSYAFNVGIVANMRIGNFFDLRFIPGFSIAHEIELYYRFDEKVPDPNNKKNPDNETIMRKIDCQYINLPLLIKFKSSRMHNVRMYAIAGGQLSVNVMSGRNNNILKEDHEIKAEIKPIIKPYDVQVKGGFGFDFYTTYFKFTTEFKVALGVINLLETEKNIKDKDRIGYYHSSPIISGLQSLKSKTFTISFIIE